VVAVEWAAVVGLLAFYAVGAYWVARYLSCADGDTVYASGYSDAAWAGVERGASQLAVKARLGEPLGRWEGPDGEWWSYSRHGTTSDNYLERKLRFDGENRVTEKHQACYID
jgi:hypothetical protein